ncbi:FAD-dependent monooxygenase [Microbacterium sp. ARD31]|uniref:FAD-dependent monooxygenase n=1 Tax=Microbacterium sp. ARD31 TaxID=2962576 RepID=UPI002880F8B0|nr:FAD-dependent monooxygenase [Microbacterium sp. ARD31]MDT0183981.1 FAD-dependent monooxygenase [Microbacterium sp. ARD31]
MKRIRPEWEVVLFERNRATDAFGFGVVFSDATLRAIDAADPLLSRALGDHGVHWDAIEVRAKGEASTFGGNGMAAIHRRVLLQILQEAAASAEVDLRFETTVSSLAELDGFDVVVAADGANSFVREQLLPQLGHHVETATAKFIWFGTTYMFDGLTFVHAKNEHGHFAVHAYPISDSISTFIVETDEDTWRRAGLDEFDVTAPPGPSDEKTRAYLTELFAPFIDGGELIGNSSRWANFRTRRTDSWHSGNVAFLGDAVHTAHFSVGSGTKMAMEDAIALAEALAESPDDLDSAFSRYEGARQPSVARIQEAARPSLAWWERFGEYYEAFDPWQFAFHFFSRSIAIDKLRQRDPRFVDIAEQSWLRANGAPVLHTPLEVAGRTLSGRRLVVRGRALVNPASGVEIGWDEGTVIEPGATAPVDDGTAFVLVRGGDEGHRIQLAEDIRLRRGVPTVIELDSASDAAVETLVLSGRVDAVAVKEGEA